MSEKLVLVVAGAVGEVVDGATALCDGEWI